MKVPPRSRSISCEVESMFHQFFVNEEDGDLLRFFWWENGDLDTTPVEYRMQVHLFGAGSSPGRAKKNSELRLLTSFVETSMSMMA